MSWIIDATAAALPIAAVVLKATLLLIVAVLGASALRRAPAGARHLVWLAVLIAVLLLPALSRWTPIRFEVLPTNLPTRLADAAADARLTTPAELVGPSEERTVGTDDIDPQSTAAARAALNANQTSTAAAPGVLSRVITQVASSWWSIALAAWVVGAAALLAWLAVGALSVRRILRDARALTDESWMAPLCEVADRIDLAETPRLLASSRVEMPFACGVLRPTVVLPASSDAWPDGLRRIVLFHELAHVRRRDLLGHTLGRIACAVYWFHPLVWMAAKRLRAESEKACDDLVLSCGARASDYAEQLLQMVLGVRRHGAPALALPMARRKEFEGRVLAILDPAVSRRAPGRAQALGLIAALALLSVSVAAIAPATAAERLDAPPASIPEAGVTSNNPAASATGNVGASARAPSSGESSIVPSPAVSVAVTSGEQAGAAAPKNPDGSLTQYSQSAAMSVLAQLRQGAAAPESIPLSTQQRIALLTRLLRTDESEEVRETAAWGLQQMQQRPEVTEVLLEAALRDASSEVRETAAWALVGVETDRVTDVFADLVVNDKSDAVRETAAWGLGNRTNARGIRALEEALRDETSEVRESAAWALGQLGLTKAPAGLVKLLDDESSDVRETAAWALAEIEDPSTSDALTDAFEREKDGEVRQAELRALVMMGAQSKRVVDLALASSQPELRAHAVRLLAGLGAPNWPQPRPRPRPRPMP
jgi:beta-lactamase regulating signal transducer with metallopeptidase domain